MILDKIENARLYFGIHPGLDQALRYLQNTSFQDFTPATVKIDTDNVYAMLKEVQTKPTGANLMESHLKYMDVQYVVSGVEQMGITLRTNQIPKKAYNETDDYMLFDERFDVVTVRAGMFAIFFPDDIHLPEITTTTPSTVQKVVVKVKIQHS